MTSFDQLFFESQGRPVIYRGQPIWRFDRFPVSDGQQIRIRFETVNSPLRQGVDLSTDGAFEVNKQIIRKRVVLWHDTAPAEVVLRIRTKKDECMVWNVWDFGNGVTQSWTGGAAMIIEECPNGKRYRCNDGVEDSDFDDLIFCIEAVIQ